MNDKPQKKTRLFQFAPTVECPDYPGVYGWGFDSHGYRFVVYAPEEFDHPAVQNRIAELQNHQAKEEAQESHTDRVRRHAGQKPGKRRKSPSPDRRGEEHGPAHVHVFHIESGRETRFELLEHYLSDGHTGRPFFTGGKHNNPLNRRDVEIVQPILDKHAAGFIQAWREFFVDSKLSGYVTRISNCNGEDVEEKVGNDGWLYTTDSRGRTAKSPPPNMRQDRTLSEDRDTDGYYHQR